MKLAYLKLGKMHLDACSISQVSKSLKVDSVHLDVMFLV